MGSERGKQTTPHEVAYVLLVTHCLCRTAPVSTLLWSSRIRTFLREVVREGESGTVDRDVAGTHLH